MIIDNSPVDRAMADLCEVLDRLPAAERSAQRDKFLAVFDERPDLLFFGRMELSGTGPTHKIERSTLHPSQFHLDWIAALRAGKLDWDVEKANGL
ncbi:hypothetical protein [Aurantimonas sp. A3-2-R12]|uniref:hypothetical protein n=1 Tax=Aurantimonas sp. A3-2-R12 TaxID=3114362 RepID=UPI002E191747|nr:hypothetical protein [Aurantimonas sp. A3-2-R12]